MGSERRFIFAFAVSDGDDIQFMNVTTTISGNMEKEIEKVKQRVTSDFADQGIKVMAPVLLSTTQLDMVRPPNFVELPIMVRRSMEQIVIDYNRGKTLRDVDIQEIGVWLTTIQEES